MAISYKSNLHDGERSFVLAIDRYEHGLREGILYHGKNPEGFRFTGYPELLRIMDGFFRQLQFPHLTMNQRTFGNNRDEAVFGGEVSEGERRLGQTATFTLRVSQRQNASWQGTLYNQATGRRHSFASFLDMVCRLDEEIGKKEEEAEKLMDRASCQRRLERYLCLVMECKETMKILPDTLVYRFRGTERNRTFMVRPMFYEHNTCQGILYWKECKKQKNFRSFWSWWV